MSVYLKIEEIGIYILVQFLEKRVWWDDASLKGHDNFEDASQTTGAFEVTYVGFD